MITRDIYKINRWIEEEFENTKYSSSFHSLKNIQNFPYIDKIKYYEKIEFFLEKYIIEKLELLDNCKIIPNQIEINYQSLHKLFEEIMSSEERQQFFENFCFYILSILSSVQGYEIVWHVENDKKYIDNFTLKMDVNVIDKLCSHQDSDFLKIFIYLLNVLKLECYRMEGYSRIPSKIKK